MPKSKQGILLSLFVLGFSSLYTQVFLLREFLSIFNGNELVLGIVLANWMLLTGTGAYLGRFFRTTRNHLSFVVFLQLLITLLPILTLVKLDLWHALVLPEGTMAGLTQIILASFIIQAPFCLLNGFLFSAYSSVVADTGLTDPAGRSYAIEATGSIAGGILVNFLILWIFDAITGLRILLWINLMSFVILAILLLGRKFLWLALPVALAIASVPLLVDIKGFASGLLYPGQEMLYDRLTPYGRVVITKNAGQLNFYENGLLLFSSGNEIQNEEVVHFAMIQHNDPKRILVIGGGISGIMDEILKYSPDRIDYAELNPAIIEAGEKFARFKAGPLIRVFNEDGRRMLKQTGETYDIVLINLPEPSTLQVNRYYTLEFFRELKSHMRPGGVVSLGLPSTADYVSGIAGKLNAVMVRTLEEVFRNVLILPGLRNYFLASDNTLYTDVASRIEKKGISTLYVNPWYFDDNLLRDRSGFIQQQLTASVPSNRDFHPVAFFYQLQYWTTFFRADYEVIAVIAAVIILMMALSMNVISLGLFTGGFTVSSLEIIILLAFQVVYGYVFQMTGIIITVFMAGLFAGSFFRAKIYPVAHGRFFLHVQLTLALFSLGFPFIILAMNSPRIPDLLARGVFFILAFLSAFLAGLEFSLAAAIRKQYYSKVISENYSADLFGSALGAILMTVILLPFLGLIGSCLVLAGLNLLSAGILLFWRKKVVSL
jgi:spermidine synthase